MVSCYINHIYTLTVKLLSFSFSEKFMFLVFLAPDKRVAYIYMYV